jgi:hypothetical protein
VVPLLERQKFVNGGDGSGISRPNSNLTTPGKRVGGICDLRSVLGHDCGARNFASVHKSRQTESASAKGLGDGTQVPADLSRAGGVGAVSLKNDATAIRERLKTVG